MNTPKQDLLDTHELIAHSDWLHTLRSVQAQAKQNPCLEWGGGHEVSPLPENLLATGNCRERNIGSSLKTLSKGTTLQRKTIQPRAHGHHKVENKYGCILICWVDIGELQREGSMMKRPCKTLKELRRNRSLKKIKFKVEKKQRKDQ